MDSWTNDQIRLMKLGGNDRCNQFLEQHFRSDSASNDTRLSLYALDDAADRARVIRAKYDSRPAQLYKQVLKAERDGLPIPTELPPMSSAAAASNNRSLGKMQGFGSGPPPQRQGRFEDNPNWLTKRLLFIAVPAVVGAAVWMLAPH
jgi:Putative GTPase activating protein for Arf